GQLDVVAATIAINGGSVTTAVGGSGDGSQLYTGAVVLGATTTLTTGGTSGEDITVQGSLDSAATAGHGLVLDAGNGGDILFTGPGDIGQAADGELGFLTIANAADATFDGDIDVIGALTQTAGTGTTTFAAAVAADSVDLTTRIVSVLATSSITATGALGGIKFDSARRIEIAGALANTGGAIDLTANAAGLETGTFVGIHLTGAVSSTTGAIDFDGTGGDDGDANHGVHVDGGSLTSDDGSIAVTGASVGTGEAHIGVAISDA
ncbi:MAG: hypothetical protein P5681_25710, partial [Limnospira sp. PMC 894.15]|uniref:hypothetical protein n=1 Tax=Limnospira sp. PMC 894.15 TaxID=2981100 RepID=UPI0028E0CF0F